MSDRDVAETFIGISGTYSLASRPIRAHVTLDVKKSHSLWFRMFLKKIIVKMFYYKQRKF